MSGAILFHGEDHDIVVDAMQKKAIEILGVESKAALFSHGDYQEVMPTSKSYLYSMETIHSVVKESALPPYRGEKRIIGIFAAERMLPVHANALLKTLEDAPPNFLMLLTTTRYDDILKTILSRVQKVHVPGAKDLEDYTDVGTLIFSYLEEGRYDSFFKEIDSLSKEMSADTYLSEKKLRHFLETFIRISLQRATKDHMKAAEGTMLQKLSAKSLAAYHSNIRIKLILENLFLESQQLCYSNQ